MTTSEPKSHSHETNPQGFGVWSWDAARSAWALVEDRSEPGFEPGPGPSSPGRFDGHVVKWPSLPAAI